MSALEYEIILIPHDAAAVREYAFKCKAFRLHSLQIAPQAFSSTYAREVAFDDNVWLERLSNPRAHTFIAEDETRRIVSFLVLVGPLPYAPDELPPAGNPWGLIDGQIRPPDAVPTHYRMNGVFTLPEARRKGISEALIRKAVAFASSTSVEQARDDFVISVVVEGDNVAAKRLYEKCGFIICKTIEPSTDPACPPIESRGLFMLENRPNH